MSCRLGASLLEVPIREAVTVHFRDIGHDLNDHSVTYENGQARERTQVLMDLANKRRRTCHRNGGYVRACSWLGDV